MVMFMLLRLKHTCINTISSLTLVGSYQARITMVRIRDGGSVLFLLIPILYSSIQPIPILQKIPIFTDTPSLGLMLMLLHLKPCSSTPAVIAADPLTLVGSYQVSSVIAL